MIKKYSIKRLLIKPSSKFDAIFAFLFFAFFLSTQLQAQQQIQAVIRELAGTVEIKRAGSEAWEPANRGQTLVGDTVISTSFRSTAVIDIGNAIITVRPLTRITLSELSKTQNGEKVELNLQTGRVRSEVKPQEGTVTEFVVRSSNATSSVRGTVYEFDTNGLEALEGTVEFSGLAGAPVLVDAISYVRINERTGRASLPQADLTPENPPGAEGTYVAPYKPAPEGSRPSDPPSPPDPGGPAGPPSGPPPGGSQDGDIDGVTVTYH